MRPPSRHPGMLRSELALSGGGQGTGILLTMSVFSSLPHAAVHPNPNVIRLKT